MRARFRSIAALLLPVAASVAFVLTAQGNTSAPAHQIADPATTTATAPAPVPSGDSGDGFSWG
ncbi:hypothetical protein AB0M94_29735 [Streptomyces xanthochromogenes]|uniref:Uncharacterized protein n=1 Tax=Streptomyces xanthochromogenes TaxID=67384 RepID=A0ABQ3A7H3_9ACTN|nr:MULTISPECIES: hypothetical protein [Streptomyces]MYV95322.1 hypothetical protein [Streptomyces sp. SID1034]GGY35318.1 hypothetical protein GCM10010326_31870 [Streptomyces xanthochromogenes]